MATLGLDGCELGEPGELGGVGGLGMDGEDDGDWDGLGGRCVCCGEEGWVVLQPAAASRMLIASGNRIFLDVGVMVAPGGFA